MSDTRPDYWLPRWGHVWSDDEQVIYLPHSCDEWVIGDADDARAMAAELLRLADEGPGGERDA